VPYFYEADTAVEEKALAPRITGGKKICEWKMCMFDLPGIAGRPGGYSCFNKLFPANVGHAGMQQADAPTSIDLDYESWLCKKDGGGHGGGPILSWHIRVSGGGTGTQSCS
jgi:hypothetical protein